MALAIWGHEHLHLMLTYLIDTHEDSGTVAALTACGRRWWMILKTCRTITTVKAVLRQCGLLDGEGRLDIRRNDNRIEILKTISLLLLQGPRPSTEVYRTIWLKARHDYAHSAGILFCRSCKPQVVRRLARHFRNRFGISNTDAAHDWPASP